jgi:two-component system, chemotaxis family, protein-glutamate methylesterase/glutaminase
MSTVNVLVLSDSGTRRKSLVDAVRAGSGDVHIAAFSSAEWLGSIGDRTEQLVLVDAEADDVAQVVGLVSRQRGRAMILVLSRDGGRPESLTSFGARINVIAVDLDGASAAIRSALSTPLAATLGRLSSRTASPAPALDRPQTPRELPALAAAAAKEATECLAGAEPSGRVPDFVVLGSSTGGPEALDVVLSMLPGDLAAPVFIVQHMPVEFVERLAQRLDKICPLKVQVAKVGSAPAPQTVNIGAGGQHLIVRGRLAVAGKTDGPPENGCRPAVDVLFRSAADQLGDRALAVVLTGMGKDGLDGVRHLKAKGASCIVQDQATSVVWGMPGAVAKAGLADEIVPLDQVAAAITHRVGTLSHPAHPIDPTSIHHPKALSR